MHLTRDHLKIQTHVIPTIFTIFMSIFMFIFGIFSKILYITFLNNLNHPSIVLIYVMAFTPLIMFAEALQGNINGLMMDFLFITITIILLRVKIIYK